jgi:hypothetical protein
MAKDLPPLDTFRDYHQVIVMLNELGLLSIFKKLSDIAYNGEQKFEFVWNQGGIRSAIERRTKKLR